MPALFPRKQVVATALLLQLLAFAFIHASLGLQLYLGRYTDYVQQLLHESVLPPSCETESHTPGDGGWAGVLQVKHLEQQLAVVLQADALSVRKREQPVVVHHAVHVLDPHSVHIAIKDQVAGR